MSVHTHATCRVCFFRVRPHDIPTITPFVIIVPPLYAVRRLSGTSRGGGGSRLSRCQCVLLFFIVSFSFVCLEELRKVRGGQKGYTTTFIGRQSLSLFFSLGCVWDF